jgi:uncharacterized protein (TIGR02594 family)
MTNYPKGYEWLGTVGTLPKTIQEGLKLVGTIETPGKKNSPTILGWADECELENVYTADSIPWCGLLAAVVALRAGKPIPKHPLWALNWKLFGMKAAQPCLGDCLVYLRSGGGHVGWYIGEDKTHYHTLGGNQADAVNISRIEKKRLVGVRSPPYSIARPASSIPYILQPKGAVTTDER